LVGPFEPVPRRAFFFAMSVPSPESRANDHVVTG
jgi:hypothetical protein